MDLLTFHVEWDRRRVDIPHGDEQSVGMILQLQAMVGDGGDELVARGAKSQG